MKKAINTAVATGIILSLIFIGGSFVKQILPIDSKMDQIVFAVLFFGVIVLTLWIAMNNYSRSKVVRWGSLNLTGIIASLIAAVIFSITAFLYARYIQPGYLSELTSGSKSVAAEEYALSVSGQGWNWLKTPLHFAWYNFQEAITVLFIITIVIGSVYYILHRNRVPDERNHELIF